MYEDIKELRDEIAELKREVAQLRDALEKRLPYIWPVEFPEQSKPMRSQVPPQQWGPYSRTTDVT